MIRVEFYGLARQRAGIPMAEMPTATTAVPLGDVLRWVGTNFPQVAAECLEANRLQAGWMANIDGDQFVRDPQTMVQPGNCVLILAADAGG